MTRTCACGILSENTNDWVCPLLLSLLSSHSSFLPPSLSPSTPPIPHPPPPPPPLSPFPLSPLPPLSFSLSLSPSLFQKGKGFNPGSVSAWEEAAEKNVTHHSVESMRNHWRKSLSKKYENDLQVYIYIYIYILFRKYPSQETSRVIISYLFLLFFIFLLSFSHFPPFPSPFPYFPSSFLFCLFLPPLFPSSFPFRLFLPPLPFPFLGTIPSSIE